MINFRAFQVVGIGNDIEIIQELKEQFLDEKSKLYPINCDLSNNESLMEIFTWIEGTLGPISILINNAEAWYPDSLIGKLRDRFAYSEYLKFCNL